VPGATDAGDANDRIIYDSASGNLYYDADGTGAGSSSTLFATLTGAPAITAGDFLIVA
jgi:Ca2+-binding RTX toxin-like protein